ncbi:MAG: ABC transporter substrate-binding protein [Tissierellia bacterium]|nr:ABC transporter substrate-binding protein [Tissierellia bacterium]
MYDSLVFPAGDTVEGRVAESWEVSDDGLSYTFKIKPGIKFHNGSELKASDVKFSMDRMLTIGEGYAYLWVDIIESVEAPDDTTVVFNLKETMGSFLNTLIRLSILSEEEVLANKKDGPYGEFGDYGKAYLVTNDAGSGAYKAVDLVQQDYFYAEKNPDWFMGWSNGLAPESFKMMAITEASTVRTMMNNRELDITDQWQSSETLSALEKIEGVEIGRFSTDLLYNMYYNNKLAPMDDVNFRRAMSSLIDYDTIVNSIFIDSVKSTSPVPKGVAGHVDTNVLSYDIEKAKEYLAASKYADTYKDYTIEIVCNSDVADLEKVALMIQSAASEVGINIEISKAPWVSIIDRVGSIDTTPHMLAINSAPSYDEAGSYLESRYHSKTAGTWEQGEWLENEELDAKIEDAIKTLDQTERFNKYAEIQNYIVDELYPSAYLCDLTERVAYQKGYLTWPAVEPPSSGGVASALNGYLHIFSNMELHLDKK